MSICLPHRYGAAIGIASSTSFVFSEVAIANQRLPTDPLFYANITLQNVAVGSAYWIAQASNLDNVLAIGTATSAEVVLENIPAYANPMLIEIRVRKGTTGTRYAPFKIFGYLVRTGATVYVSQVEIPLE